MDLENKLVLQNYWKSFNGKHNIILFNSSSSGKYKCFSNYWKHKPFYFTIPSWCGKYANTIISITFSEKAIMLCKASLFNDDKYFNLIYKAKTPTIVKQLGRQCKFDQNIWNKYICDIALEVIYQKFTKVNKLKDILINTDEHIIAETSSRNKIWGIGMSINNNENIYPSKWKGTNILGWALMSVRYELINNNSSNINNIENNNIEDNYIGCYSCNKIIKRDELLPDDYEYEEPIYFTLDEFKSLPFKKITSLTFGYEDGGYDDMIHFYELPNLDKFINLEVLSCYKNNLRILPNLDKLTKLKEIWIHKNQLYELPSLDKLHNLEILEISYNNIKYLDNDIFKYNFNLEEFEMRNNNANIPLSIRHCKYYRYYKSIYDITDFYQIINLPELINNKIKQYYYKPVSDYYYNCLIKK